MLRALAQAPRVNPAPDTPESIQRQGLLAGLAAYTMWGFFPVYFKATEMVGPIELVLHRIVWSLPFGLLVLVLRKQVADTVAAFRDWQRVKWLLLASVTIAINWGLYIWAIQNDRIFEASLGYYINPLIYVVVGVAFFSERLNRWQGAAIALAAFGVAWLTVAGGVFPWVSLVLASSFTVYGVVRKQVAVGAMPGLFVEIAVLWVPSVVWLAIIASRGASPFLAGDPALDALILFAGPLTVVPLLCFAIAARRLRLSTLGFLQFVGPTLQFVCGLYYGEAFTAAHAVCFGSIWVAVGLFVWGLRKQAPPPPKAPLVEEPV